MDLFYPALIKSLQIYGIAIVIAMLVAALIKLMVHVTTRLEQPAQKADEVPMGEVCPVFEGVPEEDVAALSAAIFAIMGPHHILHITEARRGWISQGRAAQHTSHGEHPRARH